MAAPNDSTTARYLGESGRAYHELKRSIPKAAIQWVSRSRAKKIQPYVCPTDVVFEYGAGYGWNLAELSCARKIAFEIAESTHGSLREHGIELCTSPDSLPDGSIDVIICHHTLEHLREPSRALGDMHRLLRPGAKLLVFVPYEKEARYRTYNPTEPNHHLYSWNVQTLGNLVQDCGFELIESRLGKFRFDRFAAQRAVQTGTGESGFKLIRAIGLLIQPEFEVIIVAKKSHD
jgi:SAM-dependent methyltransferase